MNIDEAISKIETIASRIDDPIHIGGWESMFEGKPLSTLCIVKGIYLFGSATYVDDPGDIDLLIDFDNTKNIDSFIDERRRKHSSYYWERYSPEQLLKKTLKNKIRNVDIKICYGADSTGLVTDLKFLVWSPEKPDVKQNFEIGRDSIDLTEECRNLRRQIRKMIPGNVVLRWLSYSFTRESDILSENEKLLSMNRVFLKRHLPELREFIKNEENFLGRYPANRELLEKFIEIKEDKNSFYLFMDLKDELLKK